MKTVDSIANPRAGERLCAEFLLRMLEKYDAAFPVSTGPKAEPEEKTENTSSAGERKER